MYRRRGGRTHAGVTGRQTECITCPPPVLNKSRDLLVRCMMVFLRAYKAFHLNDITPPNHLASIKNTLATSAPTPFHHDSFAWVEFCPDVVRSCELLKFKKL